MPGQTTNENRPLIGFTLDALTREFQSSNSACECRIFVPWNTAPYSNKDYRTFEPMDGNLHPRQLHYLQIFKGANIFGCNTQESHLRYKFPWA